MNHTKMKPVKVWALISSRGDCAWSSLYISRAVASDYKKLLGATGYRIARVELREVTK